MGAYAELYGRVERKLFAEVAAGRSATALKSMYLQRHGIPARLFNGVRVSLEGKLASVKEQQKLRADDLPYRLSNSARHGRGPSSSCLCGYLTPPSSPSIGIGLVPFAFPCPSFLVSTPRPIALVDSGLPVA